MVSKPPPGGGGIKHFYFEAQCPMYEELRIKFLNNVAHLPLNIIMATRGKKEARDIANFICFALKKRCQLL